MAAAGQSLLLPDQSKVPCQSYDHFFKFKYISETQTQTRMPGQKTSASKTLAPFATVFTATP